MRYLALLLLLLPAACGTLNGDPMQKPGTWHPTGANDANLRAMIANPADLAGRIATTPTDATLSTIAIERLLAGKTKLSAATGSGGGAGFGGGGSGGGGGAGQ